MTFHSGYKTYIAAATLGLVCVLEMMGIDVVPGIDRENAFGFFMNGVLGATLRGAIGNNPNA